MSYYSVLLGAGGWEKNRRNQLVGFGPRDTISAQTESARSWARGQQRTPEAVPKLHGDWWWL